MKRFNCFLLVLCLSSTLFAQEQTAALATTQLSDDELEKLVAPIALYPDSLIALLLPASTTSSDVVLAARFLAADGDVAKAEHEPWSDSVRSLAHFPPVVKWMDENLAWTRQLGDVFLSQPADVMNAIQRVRAKAKAAGLLADTAQQRVVMLGDQICIVPVRAEIIYVPYYDPEILWTRRAVYGRPFITFGLGFSVGSWLFYDCDWPRRTIWVHRRAPGWAYRPGWHHPVGSVNNVAGAQWKPSHHARPSHHHHRNAPVPTTRIHVDAGRSRPPHNNSYQRGTRSDPQTHVWQNKGRSARPAAPGGQGHVGRIKPVGPPPAQGTSTPAPASAVRPVRGGRHDHRGAADRSSVSPGSSYTRSSSGATPTPPHRATRASRTPFNPASTEAAREPRTGRAAPPPATASGAAENTGRGQTRAGR